MFKVPVDWEKSHILFVLVTGEADLLERYEKFLRCHRDPVLEPYLLSGSIALKYFVFYIFSYCSGWKFYPISGHVYFEAAGELKSGAQLLVTLRKKDEFIELYTFCLTTVSLELSAHFHVSDEGKLSD